jgi:predicted RNA-binding Zn-ribbon protein involved in translation (DUF1610 family)
MGQERTIIPIGNPGKETAKMSDFDRVKEAADLKEYAAQHLEHGREKDTYICPKCGSGTGKHKTKYGRKVPLCECCGYAIGDSRYNYCPNCGAKVVDA